MVNIKKIVKPLIFSLLAISSSLYAEAFRVRKTHILTLTGLEKPSSELSESAVQTASVGTNDSICILLPDDLTFIQGIEVIVKIPEAIARCPNTIVYSLYDNISPMPSPKTIDYTGKELYTSVYPGKISQTIQIPLVRGNTIKQSPYADKSFIPEHSRNFIFIRNQLAMKGVPKDTINGKFLVTAKPIYINKGAIQVNCGKLKPENITVLVDENIVELSKNGTCLLKTGTHNITLSADGYRNQNCSVVIETAKVTKIDFELQSVMPTLQINMPQGTHVMVDNQNAEVKGSSLELSPGEHTLKFTLGGYEVVKKVTIQEGRSYTMNISIDADFTEN